MCSKKCNAKTCSYNLQLNTVIYIGFIKIKFGTPACCTYVCKTETTYVQGVYLMKDQKIDYMLLF